MLLKVFESIVPLGAADWNDFVTNFQASHPHIVLIPCIGHLLNNVAKDASKDYEDILLVQLRKYYTQAFHGQGTRRAEYAGVALEVRLTEFDETSQSAEETLFQWYGILGSKQLDETSKEQALATLRNALTSLSRVIPMAQKLQEEAKRERVRTTPKLGGVTRWIADKFTWVEYISTELPTIAKFVTHIVSKPTPIPPASICSCYDILKVPGAVDAIMSEGKAFLKRLEPLRTSPNLFSDENNVAIATCVESTLSMLRKEGPSNPPLAAALQHHESRLNKNHATPFWKDVRWLSPTFIIWTTRTQNYAPITCARANDLLKNNAPMFHCTEAAWETYVTHEN